MAELTVFNKSVRGASHIQSGKPCQDYSISYSEDGIRIVVVCDGHGGNTYFRSDEGAKIAAQNAKACLINFAKCISPATFKGKSFSITAQPKRNPFIDADGNKLKYNELSDDQKKLALQAQSYIEAESKFQDEQKIVKDLLSQIYKLWLSEIEKHAIAHPLSNKEKNILGGLGLEKAYGCTMLGLLQTKDYWLSFHIGDGKIYCCDQLLSWKQPVPEDCACFLNFTTSLCDNSPLMEFRYSFCGEGESPAAFFLCTDGLDGSLRTCDNIQDFYEQIIGLCLDGDDVESELDGYLPKLSESGSRDDISLAGYVDLSRLNISILRHTMELKKRSREIRSDYRNRKTDIESLDAKIDSLKLKYERQKDVRFSRQAELDDMRQEVKERENEMAELDNAVNSLKNELDALRAEFKKKKSEFEDWKFTVKNEMAEIEAEQNVNSSHDGEIDTIEYTNW